MKKFLLLVLALALGACTAAPTAPAAQPVAPEPIVVTVVVEPTQAPQEQQPIVVTVVVQATPIPPTAEPPPTQAPAATTDASAAGTVTLDNLLGKGVFTNITLSSDNFSLRCIPREVTISATAALVDIEEAELFYRIVDQPKALYPSEWNNAGRMKDEGNGNFSMVFSGENVHPNLRLDLAWFEFQLIGLNSGGGVVDRTEKIEQIVTYRIDCP